MEVICICGQRLRLWISNKDELSVVSDAVVTTGILFEDKIGSRVGMSGLKEVGSSLRRNEAMEKGSTIDDDGVECDGARENALTVDDNGVGCDHAMEKESTVDNDEV